MGNISRGGGLNIVGSIRRGGGFSTMGNIRRGGDLSAVGSIHKKSHQGGGLNAVPSSCREGA